MTGAFSFAGDAYDIPKKLLDVFNTKQHNLNMRQILRQSGPKSALFEQTSPYGNPAIRQSGNPAIRQSGNYIIYTYITVSTI